MSRVRLTLSSSSSLLSSSSSLLSLSSSSSSSWSSSLLSSIGTASGSSSLDSGSGVGIETRWRLSGRTFVVCFEAGEVRDLTAAVLEVALFPGAVFRLGGGAPSSGL